MHLLIGSIIAILVSLIIFGLIISLLKKVGVVIAIILAIGGMYWGLSYIKERLEVTKIEETQKSMELNQTIEKMKQDPWERPDFEKRADSEKQAIAIFKQADKQFDKKQYQSALTGYQKSLSMSDPEQHPIIIKKIAMCLNAIGRSSEGQIYQEKYDRIIQKRNDILSKQTTTTISQSSISHADDRKYFSPRFNGWWVWILKYLLYIAGIVTIIISIAAVSDGESPGLLLLIPVGIGFLYGGYLC